MDTDNNGSNPVNVTDGNSPTTANSRRRFVSGVGIIVPSVLTSMSRSALAQVCHSPSAAASINLTNSRPDRPGEGQCLGRTPGFWYRSAKTHPLDWQAVGGEGKLASSIYAGGYPGKTIKEVMGMQGHQDGYQLGAHLCAAWCNWKRGWVPESVLSLSDLQAMWAGRFGNYSPVNGVMWGAEDIVQYLQTTMTL